MTSSDDPLIRLETFNSLLDETFKIYASIPQLGEPDARKPANKNWFTKCHSKIMDANAQAGAALRAARSLNGKAGPVTKEAMEEAELRFSVAIFLEFALINIVRNP
ncbi:MAG: hypothetical protein LBR53_10310 [Deltaproteobacteria bacterium]|nr:hypothetical protein [Deltaproteobacteria bacterium]